MEVPLKPALELVDQVHSKEELVPRRSIVVATSIPRVIEPQLRPQHDRAANVLGRVQRVFCVLARNTCTLSLLIIQKIRTKPDKQLRIELTVQVIDNGILRSRASQLTGRTESSIRTKFRWYRIGHVARNVRNFAFVHVPGLGRHMPLGIELVI